MKIAVLIRNFKRNEGGAERYCVEISERLSKENEVHVFSQSYEKTSSSITFHKISKFLDKPRFINQLFFSFLTKKATRGKFDIIHSHEMVSEADIYTIHVPCFKSIWIDKTGFRRLLSYLNTILSPRKISYLLLEKKQMQSKSYKQYISVSDYLSQNIIQCYPEIKKISTASPASSYDLNLTSKKLITTEDLKNKLSIPQDSFLMLLVANNFKKKGLPTVIEALDILKNKKIHLIVAGSDKYKNKSISKHLKNNIHFLGVVKEMSNIYSQVDLLIHPTLADTFGMAPLEAMSHKVPVIISDLNYCGFSEYLSENHALILDDPRDTIELASKISILYLNPDTRDSIAQKGYELSKTISWDETLKNTLEVFNLFIKNTAKTKDNE
jgi:glycosyltransferase involved in cell wall biosynthesis